MNASDITLDKIDGIYDIQPLIRPAYSTFELTVLFFFVTLIIATGIYFTWKYHFSRKAIAKRKIIALQAEYLNNNISSHDCIYQLCNILRQGLKLKQLDTNITLPERHVLEKENWDSFIRKISDLRYKQRVNTSTLLNSAFNDSLYWLKTLP